jgi:hypothetical protein
MASVYGNRTCCSASGWRNCRGPRREAAGGAGRRARLDHLDGFELDVLAAQVLEHPGAASEEHGYEVDPDLIHQPSLDELPADVRPAHHGDVLLPGGRLRLFERAFDAVRDEGVDAPFGDGVGRCLRVKCRAGA